MKKLLFSLLMIIMLFSTSAKAQTSYMIGISGADQFNNLSAGVTAGIIVPFLHRYEFDLQDTYSPYETHVGLGHGHANIASAGGIVWLGKNIGISGKIEDSGYSVTQVSKTAFYVLSGLVIKHYVFGIPSRVSVGYAGQVNNGILNGIETSKLQGAYVGIDSRLVCSERACLRFQEQLSFGRVLEQGNPVCDGTYGADTCGSRNKAFGGGVSVSLVLDLHRKTNGDDLF